MDENNNFEKFPGSGGREASFEQKERAKNWERSMNDGVPEFRGDKFGVANPENNYYGEAKDDGAEGADERTGGAEAVVDAMGEEYDEGIADAAELINYGLNEAARTLGVEAVVQKIRDFDASGREDPIGDLFKYLGVDSPEERKKMQAEGAAAMAGENAFRAGVNAPSQHRSREGAFQALDDMKELIVEVEGADPRYDELRNGARAAGKGYFEYAVDGFGVQGLPELFQVLAMQREQADALENKMSQGLTGKEINGRPIPEFGNTEVVSGQSLSNTEASLGQELNNAEVFLGQNLNNVEEDVDMGSNRYNLASVEGANMGEATNTAQQRATMAGDSIGMGMGADLTQFNTGLAGESAGVGAKTPEQGMVTIADQARASAEALQRETDVVEEQLRAAEDALGQGDVARVEEELERVIREELEQE